MLPLLAQVTPLHNTSSSITPSLVWSLPFAVLLLCIALMPLFNKHWWERRYPWVTVALAVIPMVYYMAIAQEPMRWIEGMLEYVSFIVLLASLYIVSGGVMIHVGRKATPLTNCVLLLLGGVSANVFGTTGASMLLIRPYLRMNRGHIKPFHVVFFIFIVSNCGGALTPVGDPPLFLGYLRGVPFWWVFENCWPAWVLTVGLLLAIFFVLDARDHANEERQDGKAAQTSGLRMGLTGVEIIGIHNFLFIALILFAVFRPGLVEVIEDIHHSGLTLERLGQLISSRELLMIVAATASKLSTLPVIYKHNEFTLGPMREVAILFLGIFSTMAPALHWLNDNAHTLPVKTPGQFYFASGALSSVLDNAPTYLSFLEARIGELEKKEIERVMAAAEEMADSKEMSVNPELRETSVGKATQQLVHDHPDDVRQHRVTYDEAGIAYLISNPSLNLYLVAISLGSVFFGAVTYIGNGPNFMVKSIADAAGVQTPSFLGYILRYSLVILLPIYVLVWAIFLR